VVPLTAAEAARLQHELAGDPAAGFFRVTGTVPGANGVPPLHRGDTLVALREARPNEGDLVVVQLVGNGWRLGRSCRGGTWCLLAGGGAVPLFASDGDISVLGVVVGVIRKLPAGEPG
jgi:hypothetical protein